MLNGEWYLRSLKVISFPNKSPILEYFLNFLIGVNIKILLFSHLKYTI